MFVAGDMEDHIHIYAEYPKTAKWLKDSYRELQGFHWQSGYGGFSVSRKGDAALQEYIRNQEAHHKTMSFQEEYLILLKRFGVSYDPRYVFD